jgi:hypothetical protein
MEAAVRDDMSKVLVESPRSGRSWASALEGARRQRRNRLDPDGEGAPSRVGMRRDALARKHFGEHLGPLFRYLRQQIRRPWAKVYGELCAKLDRRSVVQAHLFQHISDQVDVETVWHDDAVWVRNWRGLVPLNQSRAELFVHPRTGILLPNRLRLIEVRRKRQERQQQREQGGPDRRTAIAGMSADSQWYRIDGIWYEVKLAALDVRDDKNVVYDVVLKRNVSGANRSLLDATHGKPGCYAIAKRQLDRGTLRKHGLTQSTLR